MISAPGDHTSVGARESARARGRRIGFGALAKLGEELRLARLDSSISLETVASRAGTSRWTVARYQSGRYEGAKLVEMSELLAISGLGLAVSTYPLGDGPRDSRHASQLADFLAHVSAPLAWRTEVPLPNAGDARAWDAVKSGRGKRTGVELERALRDTQALGAPDRAEAPGRRRGSPAAPRQ